MFILGCLILGLIAGFVASNIVGSSGQSLLLDLVLGVVGAIVGGYMFSVIAATDINGFDVYSMLVAIGGAIVVLWLYHAVNRRPV